MINSKDSPWSNQPTWRRTWWLVHDPVCSWQGLSWNTWAEWHVECQVHPVLKQLLLRPCGVPIIWLRGTTWLPHQHQSINGFGKDLATNMWGKWTHHICSSHWLISSPQSTTNKISFERGPQGERGPGLEASKINFDRVFAFVWKTRSKLILGASRA